MKPIGVFAPVGFFMLNQEDTQMKKTIAFNQIAATERGGVLKILAGSVLTTSLLISQGLMAADGNNPCNELLTLGLYNTTQSSDATQSRSLVTSQFCSADFSKITDNNYQYGKSTNAQTLNIEASYGPASGSVGSSSSGSNTTVVSRDSIIQKQSELCTKGFNSQEYIKNTSDYAKVVYQGSLDAWNQCNNLNASGLKFKTTPSSNLQGLTIDLSAMSTGSSLALTGVMQDGGKTVCTTTLPPRNSSSRSGNVITVDASTYVPFNNSATLSISCKREMIDDGLGGLSAEQTNLHFKTSAGTVVVPMAAIGKVPRVAYDKAVADIKNLADTQISTISSAVQSISKVISGNIDSTTVSQNSTLPLLLRVVPAGTIMAYWSKTIPDGWLLCDGSKIPDGAVYDPLRKAIGVTLPDLRGTFLRGAGQNSNTALRYTGDNAREVGQAQLDTFKSHVHSLNDYTFSEIWGGNWGWGGANANDADNAPTNPYKHDTFAAGDEETRPKNVSVNWIIKY